MFIEQIFYYFLLNKKYPFNQHNFYDRHHKKYTVLLLPILLQQTHRSIQWLSSEAVISDTTTNQSPIRPSITAVKSVALTTCPRKRNTISSEMPRGRSGLGAQFCVTNDNFDSLTATITSLVSGHFELRHVW